MTTSAQAIGDVSWFPGHCYTWGQVVLLVKCVCRAVTQESSTAISAVSMRYNSWFSVTERTRRRAEVSAPCL